MRCRWSDDDDVAAKCTGVTGCVVISTLILTGFLLPHGVTLLVGSKTETTLEFDTTKLANCPVRNMGTNAGILHAYINT